MATAWLLIAMPLIVFAVAVPLLPAGSSVLTGLVLNAAAPSITVAPAFALILGVEPALAMTVTVVATALAPFTLPAMLGVLGLGALVIPTTDLLVRLLVFVTVVFAGAWGVKRLAGEGRITRHGPAIDGMVVLLMLVLAIGIMDGVTAVVISSPLKVALYMLLAFAVNARMQVVGGLVWWWRDRSRALVAALLSGYRNMAMILAVIIDIAPSISSSS